MKRTLSILALLWPLVAGGQTSVSLYTNFSTSGLTVRNDFTGLVGLGYTNTEPITVTHLGRWVVSGNSNTHTISLVRVSDRSVAASVTITNAGVATNQFTYASCTPVILTTNVLYCLVSSEVNGGDGWYDNSNIRTSALSSGVYAGATYGEVPADIILLPAVDIPYVPTDLKYYIPTPPGPGISMTGQGSITGLSSVTTLAMATGGTIGPLATAANGDDGYIWFFDDSWNLSGGDEVSQGESTSTNMWGYYRFTLSAAIPAGATIASGTKLELYATSSDTWTPATDFVTIYASQSADQATISAVGERPVASGGSTALCTATVRWPAAGGLSWTNSSWAERDVTSLIQELVDDYSGLASGAHIQLWISGLVDESANSSVAAESYEAAGTNPAKLTIVYE